MSLVPPRPSPIVPGLKLDRYELLCPIAEGGMASVWIARLVGKHGFEKLVAVKTILPKFAAELRFQKMFLDEARIASRIEHTNVAQILDVGDQHDVTYLVMEFVDGDALSKVNRALDRKNQRIPAGILLRVMADVCGGLHAAHELRGEDGEPLGVVHRDVSPQNVLVSTKGVAKLIDFGIAKARDRIAGDTNTGQLKGKVHYMPPEQALGSAVDRRADVWAVGAILYHLLAGRPAYDAGNDVQTLFVLASGRPPEPLPADVHPAIVRIIDRALSHAVRNRFDTTAEMQAALEAAMVEAGIVTSTAAVASFLREHVGDRAEKRKEAISLGLKAAADREKYAAMMSSNTEKPGSISDGTASPVHAIVRSGPSVPTAATETAVELTGPRSTRGMKVAIGSAIAGGALGIAGLVLLVAGGPNKDAPRAAPPAPSAAVASASPIPPPPPLPPSTATADPVASATAADSATAAPSIARTISRTVVAPPPPKPAATTKRRVNDGF